MRLSAPKSNIWLISTIVAVAAILGYFTKIPFVTENGFWVLAAGYVIIWIGTVFKGF